MSSATQAQAIYEQAAAGLINCMVREPDPRKRAALREKVEACRQEALRTAEFDLATRRERLIDLSSDLKTIVTHASQCGVGGPLAEVRDLAEEIDRLVGMGEAAGD
jgi:hypothetical protein